MNTGHVTSLGVFVVLIKHQGKIVGMLLIRKT